MDIAWDRSGSFHPELFFHGELLNVFNSYQLCGCGENVFRNGGITDLLTIGSGVQIIRTAVQPVHDHAGGRHELAEDQSRPAGQPLRVYHAAALQIFARRSLLSVARTTPRLGRTPDSRTPGLLYNSG